MATDSKVNNQEIKILFHTMEYGHISEYINEVKDWLAKRNNVICAYGVTNPSGIKKIVNNVNSGEQLVAIYLPDIEVKQKITDYFDDKTVWAYTPQLERIKLIKKFASEIEKNGELICKIESCTRGLLLKDTRKYGLSLLVDYLRYFSNWAFSTKKAHNGPTIVYATDDTCLGILGSALGPALAQGCTTILHVDPTLCVCVALLIELSVKVGIPDGAIKLIPSSEDVWMPSKEAMVYLFADLHAERFRKIVSFHNKQVVAISKNKTPMIIFNNSDLDSACECAVSAVWGYGGMMPWATNTILVQEDVYSEFVEKMKERIKKLRIGNGSDKLADISYPLPSEIKKLSEMIKEACVQGIDVYPPHSENIKFQPRLFIGAKVYGNSVLSEDKNNCTAAAIVAFRTPKEAVALANNSRQGFAASVWCENIDLINEVTRQLTVGTVWVNSHGITKASIPFTTYKLDGTGYIGGSAGFYEYTDQCIRQMEAHSKPASNLIASAQKAQGTWNRLPLESRMETLSKWAVDLEQHKSEVLIPDLEEFIFKMYECITGYSSINASRTIENFQLIVQREAIGVVVLFTEDSINISLILRALILGNAVVLATAKNLKEYESISKFLPPGLLAAVDTEQIKGVISAAQTNPRITFIGIDRDIQGFQKSYQNLNDWDSILRRCTLLKNIWMTVGDSM